MTTTDDAVEARYEVDPADVVVQIAEETPPEHHQAIRASAVTLARRSAEATRRALERGRAEHEVLTAMARPVRQLIDEDSDAAAALTNAVRRIEADGPEPVTPASAWPTVDLADVTRSTGDLDFLADQIFGAPFHFQWQWHNGQPPQTSSQDRPTGRIEMSSHADQNNNWSDAHGGFGVVLTTDRVQAVAGRSLRRTQHGYYVHAGALGGSATVEGGMEMTALEDGRLVSFAHDKRFRRRVSNGERDSVGFDGWSTGEGIELHWVMLPGRVYTFNVGAWVFCEAHGGLGTASPASATLHGLAIALTADVTD